MTRQEAESKMIAEGAQLSWQSLEMRRYGVGRITYWRRAGGGWQEVNVRNSYFTPDVWEVSVWVNSSGPEAGLIGLMPVREV